MKSPLARIRQGAFVLAAVLLASVLGYRFLGGHDWIESVWLVVITVSTVGYAESSQMPDSMQLFTVLVIVFGISAAAYTFGGLVQVVLEGEIERILGRRRMTREIRQLEDHVIICGFGRMGQNLAADLHARGHEFVILESELDRVQQAQDSDYLCLLGDATEESLLLEAGLERARTVVTGLPTDAANVFITLTARNLNTNVQIISRAELQSTERKLRQAGADRIVMPALIGARQMVRMITRPSTADLLELMAETSYLDLELDEIKIADATGLEGVTVRETEARRHRLLVVAITHGDGSMLFNPEADYRLQADDIAILIGDAEGIEQFRRQYRCDVM